MTQSAEAESAIRRIQAVDGPSTPLEPSVIALASICEGFTDHVIRGRVDSERTDLSSFGLLLLSEVEDDFSATWDNRLKWLSKGFQLVDLGGRTVQDLRVLIDLRNAIVHGDGHLSVLQTRTLQKQLSLERQLRERLAVTVEARRLQLSETTIRLAGAIAISYIESLDRANENY